VSSKSPAVNNNNNNNKKAGSAAPTPKATPLKAAAQAATPKSVVPASKAVVPTKEVEKEEEEDAVDDDVSGSDSLDLDAFGDDEPIFYGVKLTPGAEFVALPPADLHLTGVRFICVDDVAKRKTFFIFFFFYFTLNGFSPPSHNNLVSFQ
jgi:hypothetical protein